jgi:hypothetical protein
MRPQWVSDHGSSAAVTRDWHKPSSNRCRHMGTGTSSPHICDFILGVKVYSKSDCRCPMVAIGNRVRISESRFGAKSISLCAESHNALKP